MIGHQANTALLGFVGDWRDELQRRLGDARHTVGPRAFKLLAAEVKTFRLFAMRWPTPSKMEKLLTDLRAYQQRAVDEVDRHQRALIDRNAKNVGFWHLADINPDAEHVRS